MNIVSRSLTMAAHSIIILLLFGINSGGIAQTPQLIFSGFWNDLVDVYPDGNFIYAAYVSGLAVFYRPSDQDPVLISTIGFTGEGRDVVVSNGYAFLADDSSGLQIVDVHDPYNPVFTGNYITNADIICVAVIGDYAFAGTRSSGMLVIDISDPAHPALAAQFFWAGEFKDIEIANNLLYADNYIQNQHYLKIIDASDPLHLVSLANYPNAAYNYQIYLHDIYAFLPNGNAGMKIIDISDPENPTFISIYDHGGSVGAVAVSGTYAYVATNGTLEIVDISDIYYPLFHSSYGSLSGGIRKIGNRLIEFDSEGISVIGITNPIYPSLIGSYRPFYMITGSCVDGDYAYIATGWNSGLKIIDISNPYQATLVGSFVAFDGVYDIDISGDYAYLISDCGYYRIVDISDPADPRSLCDVRLHNWNYLAEIRVEGDYSYITVDNLGIMIVDNTNPAEPVVIGSYRNSGYARAMDVLGDYGYIAYDDSGLYVMDISDRTDPEVLNVLTFSTYAARDVYIDGNYLYVAHEGSGSTIFDISDPANPISVGTLYYQGGSNMAFGLHVDDNTAYVADDWFGVTAYDVTEPANPSFLYRYYTPDNAVEVIATDGFVFVCDLSSYIILGPAQTSIDIESAVLPVETVLIQNYPNPFNSKTNISFTLPGAQDVRLTVYDLLGRKIRILLDERRDAGTHQVVFDASGLAGGVYFSRLQAGDAIETKKMVLLK